MADSPTLLSLVAATLYAVVVFACLIAFMESRKSRQSEWHKTVWIGAAIFFCVLIVSRIFLLEDILRADLREWLRTQDMFAGRRAMQGPVVAVAIGLVGIAGFAGAYFVFNRLSGRRNVAVSVAAASCGVMVAIIAMRTISLHAMDFLLYGPPKLNWVGDLGASFVVIGAAAYYVLLLRGRIPARAR